MSSNESFVYGYKKLQNVSPFWREKYEHDAAKYWDIFYKRNRTNFFKDRHWLIQEFEELRQTGVQLKAIDVGCGVGNTIFPLLQANDSLFFYGLDFSNTAIEIMKKNPLYQSDRCAAHVVDLVNDELPEDIKPESIDIITIIFCLSAISPQKYDIVLSKLHKALKPNGVLLFRDYAYGDLTQIRLENKFGETQKIENKFYVKSDGTRVYYFEESFRNLLEANNFHVKELEILRRDIENKKRGCFMKRVWIQAKCSKN